MLQYLLFFGFLASYVACGPTPLLQWDPDTVADCEGWYDNVGDSSCEYIRKLFGIPPAMFSSWNPSVSLDCEPWDLQSYCIITQERLDALPKTTTSSTRISTTTSSTSSLAPSPTAWKAMGCYAEYPKMPILEQNMNPNGDTSLTVAKCKNTCYRRAYEFAGVQQGNQCWCSSYVGGEWTKNQTDCNMPCTGDQNTMCGGKELLNVFGALTNSYSTSTKTFTRTKASGTTKSLNTTKALDTMEALETAKAPVTTANTGAAARNSVLG